ncbi:MAG: hypothetical protein HYV08_17410 [Deltaproteobacteria bacterium]|nr:hypothetical protein [Deltaproteobacteria bacterium]
MTGVALWQRATILAAGLAAGAVLFLDAPRRMRWAVARRGAVYLVVALAIVSPWLVRNFQIFGRPHLTTDFPHILFLGNNPHSNGTFADEHGQRNIVHADPEFQAKISRASEIEQYHIFWGEVRRFVTESPGAYLDLTLRRVVGFFWFTPNAGVDYPPWQRAVYRLSYVFLLLLGGIGTVLVWRGAERQGRVRAAVLWASVLGVAAVYALTVINLRHRLPLELVLAIFAAEPLWRVGRRLRPRPSAGLTRS